MKKKVLVIALAVALIAIMVSGSLAYFTAEDKVENTFTIGSVRIDVWENNEPTDSDKVVFEKPLVPVVNTQDVTEDPGYTAKIIKVKNTGKNDAYIRTHVAVPAALLNYLELRFDLTGWTFNGAITGSSTATVDGIAYTVYTYDHTAAVTPGAFTAELLKGVYLKDNVDLEEDADGNLVFILRDAEGNKTASSGFVAHTKNADGSYTAANVNILVAAEAIQTQGFLDGATNALNSGFGVGTNPWQ